MTSPNHSQSSKITISRTRWRNSRKRLSKALQLSGRLQLIRIIAASPTIKPNTIKKSHPFSNQKITMANSSMIRSFRNNTSKNTWITTNRSWICTRGLAYWLMTKQHLMVSSNSTHLSHRLALWVSTRPRMEIEGLRLSWATQSNSQVKDLEQLWKNMIN